MTRRRPLIVAASVAVAVIAGVWAGDAASPAPQRSPVPPAFARFDGARVEARANLSAATTPEDQSAAARDLAAVYRRAAPALPDQRAPLHQAAGAYEDLAAATQADAPANLVAYRTAAQRALQADSALAASLRRPAGDPPEPLVPPVLPLVLLVAAAAGAAVSSRGRKPEPPPRSRLQPRPPAHDAPSWDAPPPGLR